MHGAWAHTPAQAQAKFNDPTLGFFSYESSKILHRNYKNSVNLKQILGRFSRPKSNYATSDHWILILGRGGSAGAKFRIALGLPVGAVINCADNTGKKCLNFLYRVLFNQLGDPSSSVSDVRITKITKRWTTLWDMYRGTLDTVQSLMKRSPVFSCICHYRSWSIAILSKFQSIYWQEYCMWTLTVAD